MKKPKHQPKTIGQRLPRPNLIRLSDVIAIPLDSGRFAYARAVRDATLAVLGIPPSSDLLTIKDVIHKNSKHEFYVAYYEPIDYPEWIYLGKWRFSSPEESKSPPVYFPTGSLLRPGEVTILDNGTIRYGLMSDVIGMQRQILKHPDNIKVMIEEHFKSLEMENNHNFTGQP